MAEPGTSLSKPVIRSTATPVRQAARPWSCVNGDREGTDCGARLQEISDAASIGPVSCEPRYSCLGEIRLIGTVQHADKRKAHCS